MKIIFANRKTAYSLKGGDTVQMDKTKEYLQKEYPDLNIKIVTSAEDLEQEDDIDIVHIFNIQTCDETLKYIEIAKKKKAKIVLSSIYWDLLTSIYIHYLSYISKHHIWVPRFLQKLFVKFVNLIIVLTSFLRNRYTNTLYKGLYLSSKNKRIGKLILDNVDIILPNSDEEITCLSEYFGIDENVLQSKCVCIPNATELKTFNRQPLPKDLDYINGLTNIVVQAARIEPLKNQLNLVKALEKDKNIPIILIGKICVESYYDEIAKIAQKRGNVYHIDFIEQSLLYEIYRRASVHVLASYRESPGLASLEAKSCGCEIVVSQATYCPIKYYQFDKVAHICNPFSPKSIRLAILDALREQEHSNDEEYFQFFSYENVAKMTYEVYERVINENYNYWKK